MALTQEEELIVEEIWEGHEPDMSEREIKMLILGIKIMAEEMAKKHEDGLMVAYNAPTNLH